MLFEARYRDPFLRDTRTGNVEEVPTGPESRQLEGHRRVIVQSSTSDSCECIIG